MLRLFGILHLRIGKQVLRKGLQVPPFAKPRRDLRLQEKIRLPPGAGFLRQHLQSCDGFRTHEIQTVPFLSGLCRLIRKGQRRRHPVCMRQKPFQYLILGRSETGEAVQPDLASPDLL